MAKCRHMLGLRYMDMRIALDNTNVASTTALKELAHSVGAQCPISGLYYAVNPDTNVWNHPENKPEVALCCTYRHFKRFSDAPFAAVLFRGTTLHLTNLPDWAIATNQVAPIRF